MTYAASSTNRWPDGRIASICQQKGRALITLDTDFSDICTYRPADYPGLLVLRLPRHSVPEVTRVIRRLLEVLKTNNCNRQLWIIERERIRIRT